MLVSDLIIALSVVENLAESGPVYRGGTFTRSDVLPTDAEDTEWQAFDAVVGILADGDYSRDTAEGFTAGAYTAGARDLRARLSSAMRRDGVPHPARRVDVEALRTLIENQGRRTYMRALVSHAPDLQARIDAALTACPPDYPAVEQAITDTAARMSSEPDAPRAGYSGRVLYDYICYDNDREAYPVVTLY